MSEIIQPHGGHASEGYGRPKEQGADFSHGIALYLEKVSVWFDSLSVRSMICRCISKSGSYAASLVRMGQVKPP